MKHRNLPPLASSLTESIRDIGYSLNTAVADIIDNSISAEATIIDIYTSIDEKKGDIKFAIIDNGIGLSEEDLISAMRLGSQSPLEERDLNDLGRFGLGMKTASFSQCRKLTVVSSIAGKRSCTQWDLDFVSETNEWDLNILNKNDINELFRVEKLGYEGTLVLWENCDRIEDSTTTDYRIYYEKLESLENHLRLIFHRFFEKGKIKISINDGGVLEYFDPFATKFPATQRLPEEIVSIDGKKVFIQAFVLPHHSKVTLQEYEENAGEGGYLKNQGFYIYRNKRLIMHGTWFRIKPKSELAKLTRIRIDLPNNMDQEWKIDAMKSQASPPQVIREKIKTLIDKFFFKSKRVYTYRGRKKSNIADAYWNRITARGEINYSINKEHPDIVDFSKSLNKEQINEFEFMLRDISLFFPTNMFFSDFGAKPGHFNKNTISDEDLEERALEHMKKVKKDFSKKDFVNKYSTSEPYAQYSKSWEEFVESNYG